MKWRLLLVIVLSSSVFTGWYLRPLPPAPTKEVVDGVQEDVRELSWQSPEIERFLADHENRVSDVFQISPFFTPSVQFWFKIYTYFNSDQIILHDKNNLFLIYKVLDFSPLRAKGLGPNTLEILQKKIIKEKLAELRSDLDLLIRRPYSEEAKFSSLLKALETAGVLIPESRAERVSLFKNLRQGVRTQTGQQNFIRDGLVRARPYEKFLRNYFTQHQLPSELVAIPFLESSFNPLAHSKANALGAWQFMPFIARHFMPRPTEAEDYRRNIGVSSISAALLMQENFRILKSWDLAVTAYNSGTKHLLKTKRSLASETVDLESVIKNSDSAHFGFASKNFYSEFLALAHALAYREQFFPEAASAAIAPQLSFYVSKCSVPLESLSLETEQLADLGQLNLQWPRLPKKIPRGIILTSFFPLPPGLFASVDLATKKRPRDWHRTIQNQSCSTK